MFRAVYRSLSGALTVFAASGLHTRVVTGRSQVWVGTGATMHGSMNMKFMTRLRVFINQD